MLSCYSDSMSRLAKPSTKELDSSRRWSCSVFCSHGKASDSGWLFLSSSMYLSTFLNSTLWCSGFVLYYTLLVTSVLSSSISTKLFACLSPVSPCESLLRHGSHVTSRLILLTISCSWISFVSRSNKVSMPSHYPPRIFIHFCIASRTVSRKTPSNTWNQEEANMYRQCLSELDLTISKHL